MNIPNREDLEQFLNNCAIGVHLVASDGTVLWANKSELSLLGYGEEDYFGKSIKQFHIDDDVINKILTILSKGSSLQAYPARLKASDGSIKHVLINSNVFSNDAEFVHTRCFTTSISEAVYTELRDNFQ